MITDNLKNCMQITVPFVVLTEWIKAKTGQLVAFSFVNERAINLDYVFKTMIPIINRDVSKEISITVSDIELKDERLQLRYDAGAMMNFLSTIIAKFLPATVIEHGVVDFQNDSTVVIHLDKVEKAHKVLQQIDVQSINFNEASAILDFALRLA